MNRYTQMIRKKQSVRSTPTRSTEKQTQKPRPISRGPMTTKDRDPRPDLKGDHLFWASVLITAWRMNLPVKSQPQDSTTTQRTTTIHDLLYGLRCSETRLEKTDTGGLKLNLDRFCELNKWPENELKAEWLIPNKKQIVAVFQRVQQSKAA